MVGFITVACRDVVLDDADFACRRRGIAALADESRYAVREHRRDRRDVAVAHARQRRFLRAPQRRVDDGDVARFPRRQEAAVEIVDQPAIAGRGGDDALGLDARQAGHLDQRLDDAERHHAGARRRVAGDQQAVEISAFLDQFDHLDGASDVPRLGDLQGDGGFVDHPGKVFVAKRHRPAVHVAGDVGQHGQKVIGVDRGGARYRGAAGVAHDLDAMFLRRPDLGRHVGRLLEGAEADLGQPHAFSGHFRVVRLRQPRLHDHRAAIDPHAAGAEGLETALRRDRQRLQSRRVRRPAGNVNFARRNRAGDAAVDVAFEKPDGLLARGVIAEGGVDVGIDETGYHRHAADIDDEVRRIDVLGWDAAHLLDPAAGHV